MKLETLGPRSIQPENIRSSLFCATWYQHAQCSWYYTLLENETAQALCHAQLKTRPFMSMWNALTCIVTVYCTILFSNDGRPWVMPVNNSICLSITPVITVLFHPFRYPHTLHHARSVSDNNTAMATHILSVTYQSITYWQHNANYVKTCPINSVPD